MKTIAQQLNVKEFPFIVKDSKGNKIYCEDSNGDWYKSEYDTKGNETYFEGSNGFWAKREYDINDNKSYYEDSDGDWYKNEFDSNGNEIYFEDSDGYIRDNRPKVVEMTMEEVCKELGKNVKIVK